MRAYWHVSTTLRCKCIFWVQEIIFSLGWIDCRPRKASLIVLKLYPSVRWHHLRARPLESMFNIEVINTCPMPFWPSKKLYVYIYNFYFLKLWILVLGMWRNWCKNNSISIKLHIVVMHDGKLHGPHFSASNRRSHHKYAHNNHQKQLIGSFTNSRSLNSFETT